MVNVLLIPEDFRKDQYILKPIFEEFFAREGRAQTRVRICNPPLLQGVTEALKTERLEEIVARYPFIDLFILCVDRDGVTGRRTRLTQIEQNFSGRIRFIAENAWEELETWLLAGLTLPKDFRWNEVRSEISCKEIYFEKLARALKVEDGPGGGRRHLGLLASKRVDKIEEKCPDDFGHLADRIRNLLPSL